MDNPIEFVTDAFQGDIEIAGKSIPKIAIVGGGVALIVVFVLLSKRGSRGSAVSSTGLPAVGGTGGGVGSDTPLSDSGVGGGVGGFDNSALQESLTQQIADSSSALTDLIAQNSAQQSSDLNSQLASVYDQLASVGSNFSGGYADNYAPVPIDLGGYSLPMDSGISAYPESSGYSLSSYLPSATNPGSVKNPVSDSLQSIVDRIKPSNVKPTGTKNTAKLGEALSRNKISDTKIDKLTNVPKQNSLLGGVLNFNKKEPNKSGISSVADKKKSNIPSPVPVKVEYGVKPSSGKSNTIIQKPIAIPTTIKNFMASGNTKTGQIAQTKKPASSIKQPSKGVGGGSGNKPSQKPSIKPVYNYPKPVPIPTYQPYVPQFANPFLGFQGYKPTYGKISSKTYKKGK